MSDQLVNPEDVLLLVPDPVRNPYTDAPSVFTGSPSPPFQPCPQNEFAKLEPVTIADPLPTHLVWPFDPALV